MDLVARLEPDPVVFRDRVWPFLAADPIRRTLPMTVLDAVVAGVYADALLVWVAVGDAAGGTSEVVACAVRTPSHHLVVTATGAAAVDALVDSLAGALPVDHELSGVVGLDPWAELAAARWCAGRPLTVTVGHRQRLFRLDSLVPPRPADGSSRLAGEADLELILAWGSAFMAEAGTPGPGPTRESLAPRLAAGQVLVWEVDDETVSYAAHGPVVAGHARIGPVYTPPALRGRGFASNLTAAVSRKIQAEGGVPALFTDRANPTSNRIYQAIGYVPVADSSELRFSRRRGGC